MFPPYLASGAWYSRWLASISENPDTNLAVATANIDENARDFSRCAIQCPGHGRMLLTIPIEGGGKTLRNTNKMGLAFLSNHGNWRKKHLAAIEAAYGKKPYFNHFFPLLKQVFDNTQIDSLKEFNLSIHAICASFLLGSLPYGAIKIINSDNHLKERSKEIAIQIKTDVTIIDPLMNLGPEAILGIFALYRKD